MPHPEYVFGVIALAALAYAFISGSRQRREHLATFEKIVSEEKELEVTSLAFSDTSEVSSEWMIEGRAGAFLFTFHAIEFRRKGQRSWFTLSLRECQNPRIPWEFGGDCIGAREHQRILSALFGRLWPVCDISRPVYGYAGK